jgi:Tol biopolymer transport system component
MNTLFAALLLAALASSTGVDFSGDARKFAPGVISTRYSDVRLTISPDGMTALWFSRNRPGGAGGYDIWMSHREAAGWADAVPVSFNTASREFDPAFSRDGRFVYFASDRAGGLGGDDLYRVAVTKHGFGAVEHLGKDVNSPRNEWAPMMFDSTLLFSSDGHGGAGRMDLFTAKSHEGRFAAVEALPGAVNTPADEFDATFLSDGISLVYTRAENLEKDPVALYYSSRVTGRYTAGNRLFEEINTPNSDTYAPMLDWSDPNYLVFTTRRPADSQDGADLYRVEVRVR